jgi:hypothetical protein
MHNIAYRRSAAGQIAGKSLPVLPLFIRCSIRSRQTEFLFLFCPQRDIYPASSCGLGK